MFDCLRKLVANPSSAEPLALRNRVRRVDFYSQEAQAERRSTAGTLPKVRIARGVSTCAVPRSSASSAAGVVLPSLRVRGGSGGMADDNRRPEHRICNNTDEQENRNHDRRNEVFHGVSLFRRSGSAVLVGAISRGIPAHGRRGQSGGGVAHFRRQDPGLSRQRPLSCQATNR